MENRRRFLEKRRDSCGQSINHLIRFQRDGEIPEGDSESEVADRDTVEEVSKEENVLLERPEMGKSEKVSASFADQQQSSGSDQKERTPPPDYPRAIQQRVESSKAKLPSPPQVQRVTKAPVQTSLVQQRQSSPPQTIQVPVEQTLQGSDEGQQYLQIVGSDGKTQLLQIVGNTVDQQVFELVSTPGQQPVLKPVSVQKQPQGNAGQQARTYGTHEEHVQYISNTPQGHVVINQDPMQEQMIITEGSHHEQIVQEHVVVTEGFQGRVTYSDVSHDQLVLNDPQNEQIVVTEGVQEQVVVSGYHQEQVVEEVVMEVPPRVAHREIVVSSSPRTARPTLQSLLKKQPEIRPKPVVSVLKPQLHQQTVGGVPMMIVTQSRIFAGSLQPHTIYSVPSAAHTAVSSVSTQASSSAALAGDGHGIQADNIIETAFAAATQGRNESEEVEGVGNSRIAVQVSKQPQVIVQQQPQQQVIVAHSQSGEMMNIDDIEVQPLQASQEDLMRTMESIASELLGVSSIDLAP